MNSEPGSLVVVKAWDRGSHLSPTRWARSRRRPYQPRRDGAETIV